MLLALLLAQLPYGNPAGPIVSQASLGGAFAAFEFAPANGRGMGAVCSGGSVTGARLEAVTVTRASVAECPSNDGQTLTQVTTNAPRVSSGAVDRAVSGTWQEDTRTNLLLQSRDLSQAVWTKTSMTCTKTATGMRNDANGASTCTASGANGTVLQTVAFALSGFGYTHRIRRKTGTGTINATVNNGTNWLPVTGLSSTEWRWVVPYEVAGCTSTTAPTGSKCIVISGLSASAANPTVGFQIVTSGDAIDLDFGQVETSVQGTSTTPIETTAASATRAVEYLDAAQTVALPTGFCAAATSVTNSGTLSFMRLHGVPGDRAPGVVTGSLSYNDSYFSPTWTAETTATAPVSTTTGVSSLSAVNRAVSFYAAGALNGCLNGTCGAGVAATWTPPTWTRYRLGGYDTTAGSGGGHINGVLSEVQLDPSGAFCRRGL